MNKYRSHAIVGLCLLLLLVAAIVVRFSGAEPGTTLEHDATFDHGATTEHVESGLVESGRMGAGRNEGSRNEDGSVEAGQLANAETASVRENTDFAREQQSSVEAEPALLPARHFSELSGFEPSEVAPVVNEQAGSATPLRAGISDRQQLLSRLNTTSALPATTPLAASAIPVIAEPEPEFRTPERYQPVPADIAIHEISRLPVFEPAGQVEVASSQLGVDGDSAVVAPAHFEGLNSSDESNLFVDAAGQVAEVAAGSGEVQRQGSNSVPGRPVSFTRQPEPPGPGGSPVATPPPTTINPTPGIAAPSAPLVPEPAQSAEEQELINDPIGALNAGSFRLATQPQIGDHYKDDTPLTDQRAWLIDYQENDFAPTPTNPNLPYDPYPQMQVYEGKSLNANQRPLVEIGRPWYQLGQLAPPSTIFGEHNPVSPQFLIFGDFRTAFATNDLNGDDTTQLAWQWNMIWNLHLTATERIVTFMNPLGFADNSRLIFDNGGQFRSEFDADFDFGYLEGDLGAIVGGFTGETLPFDFPFAVGVMPLLVQNGIWMEDAFLGAAFTIPARNSAALDISNMDFTFFAGFDEIDSPAFEGDDDVAKMWGMLSFIEAMNGYWEIDYAFLEDRSYRDRSYHNIGIGFSRRYGRFISNSTRVIVNAGQSSNVGPNTADGVLLLSENSLISGFPSTIVPYFNMFAGFDRPQSAARAGAAGGILRNTGILFESDNMTGFPTLDATANDTFGAAMGVNIMPDDFSQQLVLEVAALGVHGADAGRNAAGNQFGAGIRYQLPLSNATILRSDGMFGWLDNQKDVHGFRVELRRKF